MTRWNLFSKPQKIAVIHTMLAGTFLSRAGYFMVWPYLSVALYRNFQLSASLIGAIFFLTSVIGTLISLFASYYSDKFGRSLSLIASLVMSIAGFAMMGYSNSPVQFVAAMILISTGRACTEAFSKAMIGDYLIDSRQREKYQYIRYYIVNIGSALGPLAGTYALKSPDLNIFFITCFVYLLYVLALLFVFKGVSVRKRTLDKKEIPDFTHSILIIFSQKRFLRLLISYFIVMFVYISYDSPLIQILTRINFSDLNYSISLIFIVNAATVVVLQYPVLFFIKKWSVKAKIVLGIFLISASQILFLTIYSDSIGLLAFCVLVLSIGELITMPAFSVEVDRLAPDDLRGTSYGLINLTSLGTALCPLFGGLLIDAGLGHLMFISLFFMGVIAILIYASISQLTSPEK